MIFLIIISASAFSQILAYTGSTARIVSFASESGLSPMMVLIGMSVGGWIGWALGERFGMLVALLASLIGSAVALYFTRKLVRDFLG